MRRFDKIAPDFKSQEPRGMEPHLNDVHAQYLKLQDNFGSGSAGEAGFTPYETCLHQLVDILGWKGEERNLMEALPHLEPVGDLGVLQMVLLHLGFRTVRKNANLLRQGDTVLPCLIEFAEGPIIVTEALGCGLFACLDQNGACQKHLRQLTKGQTLLLIEQLSDELDEAEGKQASWFYSAVLKLRRPIWGALFLTCFANILTLATPIYTMTVYNRVIGGQALDSLAYFFVGIAIIIAFEVVLRRKRGRLLSYIGARIDAEITNKVFKQILTLPVSMTETASISRQIVQFRQFEAIRDLLTGNLASTLLDLPFLILFFGVIALLSGWLVLIPIVLLAVFSVLAFLTLPTTRRRGRKSGQDRSHYNRMCMELAGKMQAVRELGAEDVWLRRHARIAEISARSMFRTRFFETLMQTISQCLVMLAGLATISIGAYQVMEGQLDTGALIAIMMIVWRILTPLQIAFLSLNRLSQLKQTVAQLDRLMKIGRERRFRERPHSLRSFNGEIKFDNVSFRYGPKSEPALKGVNFSIGQGELVAITGATGSGKSSLLKLLLGLYQPQAGRIFLDGINIQQLDVGELRASIGFMPQEISIFYGSLTQNLLLSNPLASQQDIRDALHKAGILDDGPLMKEGLHRALRHENGDLSDNDLARIGLARAYIMKGSVLLLDNPGVHFDHNTDRVFIETLKRLRGHTTVLLVTSRPSHIEACDRLLQLHNGMLVNDTPAEAFMKAYRVQRGTG